MRRTERRCQELDLPQPKRVRLKPSKHCQRAGPEGQYRRQPRPGGRRRQQQKSEDRRHNAPIRPRRSRRQHQKGLERPKKCDRRTAPCAKKPVLRPVSQPDSGLHDQDRTTAPHQRPGQLARQPDRARQQGQGFEVPPGGKQFHISVLHQTHLPWCPVWLSPGGNRRLGTVWGSRGEIRGFSGAGCGYAVELPCSSSVWRPPSATRKARLFDLPP